LYLFLTFEVLTLPSTTLMETAVLPTISIFWSLNE
jgi:hypothetical protein